MKRCFVRLALALVFVTGLAGCGSHHGSAIKFTPPIASLEDMSVADERRVRDNCPFGAPEPIPAWPLGVIETVYRDGYVLGHSTAWKVPYWVCESLEESELGGTLARSDNFRADPELQPDARAELVDYRRSGYDRGHMAPAGNQTRDARKKDETFFLSNMIPQVGNMNRQIWAELEALVRSWAQAEGVENLKTVTGPVFHDDDGLARGYSVVTTIGQGVGVPLAAYKIVVGTVEGELRAVALLVENRPHSRPWDVAGFIVSISELETLTGLNFMPLLDPPVRVRLEVTAGTLFRR